ncbi:MAG TPA: DUF4340 domain-containing protein [Patescibacteria group bacterium]|jgi:hypothetical protein|nr:DUF4340 domain-containing protein [Patescibacteria group bacterium]
MRFRNTLFALILLAGLAGFIYYYEYLGEEKRESAIDTEKNLLTFERDKVQAVELQRSGSAPLTVHKESDGWKISTPGVAAAVRAEPEKIDQILSALMFLRIERKMEGIADSELQGFKLKEPAARVTLKLEEGKPDLSLSLGDKSPVGSFYFAMKPGSTDVLLVSGGVDPILTADFASLRYRKIVGLDAWKVGRFTIEKADRKLVTFKHGAAGTQDQDWRIERPVVFPADATKTQGLWSDLQAAEAEGFETEQPTGADLERLGLSRPALTLTVEPMESATPVKVILGAPAGTGSDAACYARRSDAAPVMKIKREFFDKLDGAVEHLDDFRDARLVPLDRFKLGTLEIQRTGATPGRLTLVKDEGSKWRWGAGDGAEMPPEEVNSFLDALDSARATGFLDASGPAPAGEPLLTLVARESGDNGRTVTVRVGAEGSAPAGRRVSSTATTTVYIVPPAAIQTLVDRAAALKAPQPQAQPPAAGAKP